MAIEKTKADRNLDHRPSTERSDLNILTVPGRLQMAESLTELSTGALSNAHEPIGVIAEAKHADCGPIIDRSASTLLIENGIAVPNRQEKELGRVDSLDLLPRSNFLAGTFLGRTMDPLHDSDQRNDERKIRGLESLRHC